VAARVEGVAAARLDTFRSFLSAMRSRSEIAIDQSCSKSNAACSPVPVCVERAACTTSGHAVATVLNASASCVQPFFSAIENSRNASSLTS
jgi:hypothetical protein